MPRTRLFQHLSVLALAPLAQSCVSNYTFEKPTETQAQADVATNGDTPVGMPTGGIMDSDPVVKPAPKPSSTVPGPVVVLPPVVVPPAPDPVKPTPVAPTPSATIPVAVMPSPVAPTPVAPTPVVVMPTPPVVPPMEEPVVCDPFGGNGNTIHNGLKAQLTYIPLGNPNLNTSLSTDNFAPGKPGVEVSDAQIFLSQIGAATTLFTNGFADQAGNMLKNKSNEALIEYFSIRVGGAIGVTKAEDAGDYELALLADDGALMKLDASGKGIELETVIDNEGVHGNKLACTKAPIHLERDRPLPIDVRYFQGPRYRIAFMLLWRKARADRDSECGQGRDDDYFFTSTGGAAPVPTSKFAALQSRGWSVVPAANLFLPDEVKENPCANK